MVAQHSGSHPQSFPGKLACLDCVNAVFAIDRSFNLELERTSGSTGGVPAVAVSGYMAKGGKAEESSALPPNIASTLEVTPCLPPNFARTLTTNLGGVVGSSLDLVPCDQVRIFEANTFETKEEARQYWKGRLVEALVACGRGSEADLVAHCAEDFKVGKCLDCGASPAFPITCDHRLCPGCASRRGARLVEEHSDILKRLHYPKMLSLTFLSVAHIDKAYIKWARGCFTKLRRRKVMAGCWGGIYSFEATYTKGKGWHLHIHALIGSSYIKQADLAREWQKITGACVVWIEAVKGKDKWGAVREVVKYPSKVATFIDKPNLVNEFLLATEGVNLAYGFGAMYRVKTSRHGERKMRCPLCGGSDISWANGFGFCVPRLAVERVKGGWLWRPPPAPALGLAPVEIDMEV